MVVKKKRGRPRKRPETDKKLKQKQKQKQQVVVNVSSGGGGGFIPTAPTQMPTFDYSLLANLIRPAATRNVPIAAQTVAESPFVRPAMEEPLAASKPKMEEPLAASKPKKETPPKNIIDPQGAQPEFFEEGTFQDLALDKAPASPMMTEFGSRKAEPAPLFETPEETPRFDLNKFTPEFRKTMMKEAPSGVEFILPKSSPAPDKIDTVNKRLAKYDEDIKNAPNAEAAKSEMKKRASYLKRANEKYGESGITFT